MLVCDNCDRAITCVFCRDLYLKLTISGLLKNGVFKGRGKLAKSFFQTIYVTFDAQGLPSSSLAHPAAQLFFLVRCFK